MNIEDRPQGAMSLWEQTRAQRWALIAGLVIGVVIGATVAILFRPLIYAIVLILLALLVFRFLRSMNRRGSGSGDGPAVRGMVVTGRYPDAGPATKPNAFDVPVAASEPQAPVATAPRDLRRGPEYDAEIDAILANIDRQIGAEETRSPNRPARSSAQRRAADPDVQDAEWQDREPPTQPV